MKSKFLPLTLAASFILSGCGDKMTCPTCPDPVCTPIPLPSNPPPIVVGPTPTPSPEPTPIPPGPTPTPTPQPTPLPLLGICHVSNKGWDGKDWNLQLSWKEHGEGHEAHTCPKFNPPDFPSTEENCTLSHVSWCVN